MIDGRDFEHLRVATSDDGAIVRLKFEHGKANEIGSAVLSELAHLADRLEHDGDARALISWSERVTSRGTPIFVAGANVTERVGWSEAEVLAHVRWQRAVLRAIRESPVLHVAIISGVAFGWGTEWLLTADVALATPTARFALPETGLGIVPGAGGTSELWSRIGPRAALRLGMTGEVIEADEALAIGLIDQVLPDLTEARERAEALATKAATRSPTANAAFKRALLGSIGQPIETRIAREDAAYGHCLDTGEAARGREAFAAGTKAGGATWAGRKPWRADG